MARMATGVARQDFSPISNINYDTLAQFKQAGLERVYQSDAAKQDRFRQGLKEAEQNRMIQSQTTGAIGGLLQSNPNLLTGIQEGDAPESVKKAYKSFERGGGSLESNALLANYLSTTDTQQKQAQLLQFEQDQQALRQQTALRNAQASFLKAQAEMSKPRDLLLDPSQVEQFKSEQAGQDFTLTPVNVDGKVKMKVGSSKTSTDKDRQFMSKEQYKALTESTGLNYKISPSIQNGVEGFLVGDSYAKASGYEDIFQEKLAEKRATEIAEREATLQKYIADDRPNVVRNLAVMGDVVTDLKSGKIQIGGLYEFVPNVGDLQDAVRAGFNTEGQDAVDNVRQVIFQSLKAILGGAFSAQEANRLSASAYNPQLQGQEGVELNIKRLERALEVIKLVDEARLAEMEAYRAGRYYDGVSASQILENQNDTFDRDFPLGSSSLTTSSNNKISNIKSTPKP